LARLLADCLRCFAHATGETHLRFCVPIVAAAPYGARAANKIKDSPDRKGKGEYRADASVGFSLHW